ncbi:hypothetical protein [Brumimicrobium aurantiacum]|uniref:Lipoprotein n=1 Tax=Brumimicrobium aurantiacum TaxID=1737063 RepID=A0A3E1F1I8_9FLAO|nr:hypothetical protein [Brumimicrobium aurantiacum]RFC55609.1 hypothetical protein DXU93_01365 [Brumimicrobium aurantiacum]
MRINAIISILLTSFLFGSCIVYENTSRVKECYKSQTDCKEICFQIRKPERVIPLLVMLYSFQLSNDPYMIEMKTSCNNDSINLISFNYEVYNILGELVIKDSIYNDFTSKKISPYYTLIKCKVELPVLSKKFHEDSLYLNFEGKFLETNGDTSTLKVQELYLEPTKINDFWRVF